MNEYSPRFLSIYIIGDKRKINWVKIGTSWYKSWNFTAARQIIKGNQSKKRKKLRRWIGEKIKKFRSMFGDKKVMKIIINKKDCMKFWIWNAQSSNT